MLDNSLIFCLVVSSLSTLGIYFLTNRKKINNESDYDSKELLKIFSIVFGVSLAINYLRNSGFGGNPSPQPSMRSGEAMLTHSSRPPF
jgi:hypothetical protein